MKRFFVAGLMLAMALLPATVSCKREKVPSGEDPVPPDDPENPHVTDIILSVEEIPGAGVIYRKRTMDSHSKRPCKSLHNVLHYLWCKKLRLRCA